MKARLVVAAIALMLAALPGAVARGAVICPLATGLETCCPPTPIGAGAIPCCLPPTPTPCCAPGPAIACPAALPLSLAAAPDPARAGQEVTLSGTLQTGTVAGQTVALWERPAGSATFRQVATAQTDTTGAFKLRHRVETNVAWYATSGSAKSATVAETVAAVVRLSVSNPSPTPGSRLVLSGSVSPSHAGQRVELQRAQSGAWVTIARLRLDAHSRFTLVGTAAATAVHLRVVLPADARNALSRSPVLLVRG